MLDINDMYRYLFAHRRNSDTNIIDAAADDVVLLQAQRDGYVDRVNDLWIARGHIRLGERRTVRHTYGPPSIVEGK